MATGTTRMVSVVKEMLQLSSSTFPFTSLRLRRVYPPSHFSLSHQLGRSLSPAIRCASSDSHGANRVPARLSQVNQLLQQAEHRALSADQTPPPKITIDHVTVSFARSGGPGGQNVNKVNTKVDMRFNVKNAHWLSDRVRDKILQTEKNRINKDGELVISSTKTRTQKGNIEDALAKVQVTWESLDIILFFIIEIVQKMFWQSISIEALWNIGQCLYSASAYVRLPASVFGKALQSVSEGEIIDAASYVPPPPSEEQKKKIAKMAAIGEQKRLKSKKVLSDKKAFRRSKNSWD
ncbi:hypothetical protein V8G54_015295 [Vigna mungo]|uniref:Prokaryotic-type class I peptide chain release factors domain-containing protein n=1 Tax=Vigna mungo TaxID=3915 RepID=A0AAQ3NKX1_VIGMU